MIARALDCDPGYGMPFPVTVHSIRLTRTTQQANPPSEWGMRVGAACTQTGVLAKGRAKGSAVEFEELGRELGLAGVGMPPPD